jgi:hypothetical protein
MFKLDDNFLTDIGLGSLPQDQKLQMLKDIYDTLELRVGMKLAEQMSDEQLDEFEAIIEQPNSDEKAKTWLEANFPGYKQVVAEELDKLKAEIRSTADQIVSHIQADDSQS